MSFDPQGQCLDILASSLKCRKEATNITKGIHCMQIPPLQLPRKSKIHKHSRTLFYEVRCFAYIRFIIIETCYIILKSKLNSRWPIMTNFK
jgi:hypothetical protein